MPHLYCFNTDVGILLNLLDLQGNLNPQVTLNSPQGRSKNYVILTNSKKKIPDFVRHSKKIHETCTRDFLKQRRILLSATGNS